MSKLIQLFAATGIMLGFYGTAHAHLGHVGELAGHSHWVGVGALAIAAALGTLVLRPVREKPANEVEADSNSEGEVDDEPAS